MHFAELTYTTSGSRKFNVTINGTAVLTSFDVYVTAGARYKAVLREFTTTANASGQIVIAFTNVTSTATIGGIEIVNQPPSIAAAAAAVPNPVAGTTTSLSVLGNDDGGEGNLTYTWTTTGTPPATVGFSANGSNAAKSTTATFTKAGLYSFQVTATDQAGQTAVSAVEVTVGQTLTSIVVAPASATLAPLAPQQFGATASDQFAALMSPQPAFGWSVNGGGVIDANGLFTAGNAAGGPFTVTAQSGAISGTASVTVVGARARTQARAAPRMRPPTLPAPVACPAPAARPTRAAHPARAALPARAASARAPGPAACPSPWTAGKARAAPTTSPTRATPRAGRGPGRRVAAKAMRAPPASAPAPAPAVCP